MIAWKRLREELPNQTEIRKKFEQRYKQALTPAHLLHSHYRDENISLEEKGPGVTYRWRYH